MTEDDKSDLLSPQTGSATKLESFAPADLIACEACRRSNPPNRAACIYCGAGLSTTAIEEKPSPTFAPQSTEQNSFCLVLPGDQLNGISESTVEQIASLLQLKPTEVRSCIDVGGPLPLLSGSTAEQAIKFAEEIRALGLEPVITEESLTVNVPFRKIRGLELSDYSLSALPLTSNEQPCSWADLVLIVTGRLIMNRTEVEEKHRRGSSKPLDSRQLSADESVMDLYTRSHGWRIQLNTFDFSCLGTVKGVTAFENSATMIKVIRERAPNVEVDDSYYRKRAILAKVWPIEKKDSKREWHRSGGSRFNVSTITISDNELQFNKYSRLAHYLRLKDLEVVE